jgi:hypothetical protein
MVRMAMIAAASAAAVLPSLLLSWRSPNFWYAATPAAALGAAGIIRGAVNPRRAFAATAALIVVVLIGCVAAGWKVQAYRWGPYAQSSIEQWRTSSYRGGRVVWFDRDTLAPYGGLARTIGPGDRLSRALRLATGNPSIDAVVCVSVRVAPLYDPRPDDEIFLHSAGRLEALAAPPPGSWYCLP